MDSIKVQLLGIKPVEFTSSDGKHVKGETIFIAYQDEGTVGYRTEKLFLREGTVTLPAGVKPQDVLEIAFTMKGKVEKITKA